MLRSSDTRISLAAMPFRSSSVAPLRIIGSGPHRNAVVLSGRSGSRRSGSVTKPTSPGQPCTGTSTVRCTSIVVVLCPALQFFAEQEVIA